MQVICLPCVRTGMASGITGLMLVAEEHFVRNSVPLLQELCRVALDMRFDLVCWTPPPSAALASCEAESLRLCQASPTSLQGTGPVDMEVEIFYLEQMLKCDGCDSRSGEVSAAILS